MTDILFVLNVMVPTAHIENRCDECTSWSVEEMESYVKLHKSLASKGRGKKSNCSKAPSSSRPSAPVGLQISDTDNPISSQFLVMSCEFGKKLETVSDGLLAKLVIL